jgi:hypothetical protein
VPDCIVPSCRRNALNNLGVRLRKPDTSAIWAPNANAYVCDVHARSGALVTLIYETNDSGRVELAVQGAGKPVVRRTAIRMDGR